MPKEFPSVLQLSATPAGAGRPRQQGAPQVKNLSVPQDTATRDSPLQCSVKCARGQGVSPRTRPDPCSQPRRRPVPGPEQAGGKEAKQQWTDDLVEWAAVFKVGHSLGVSVAAGTLMVFL